MKPVHMQFFGALSQLQDTQEFLRTSVTDCFTTNQAYCGMDNNGNGQIYFDGDRSKYKYHYNCDQSHCISSVCDVRARFLHTSL